MKIFQSFFEVDSIVKQLHYIRLVPENERRKNITFTTRFDTGNLDVSAAAKFLGLPVTFCSCSNFKNDMLRVQFVGIAMAVIEYNLLNNKQCVDVHAVRLKCVKLSNHKCKIYSLHKLRAKENFV